MRQVVPKLADLSNAFANQGDGVHDVARSTGGQVLVVHADSGIATGAVHHPQSATAGDVFDEVWGANHRHRACRVALAASRNSPHPIAKQLPAVVAVSQTDQRLTGRANSPLKRLARLIS